MIAQIAKYLLFAYIFSLGYIQPSVFVLGFTVAPSDFLFPLVFAFWFLAVAKKQIYLSWHSFFQLLLLYFLAMAISALFSEDVFRSSVKLFTQIYLLLLPVLVYSLIQSEKDLRLALTAWLTGCLIPISIGLIAIFTYYLDSENPLLRYWTYHFGSAPSGSYPRLRSTFLTPSLLLNYLSVSLSILLGISKIGWIDKRFSAILLVLILIVSIFTVSSGLGSIPLILGIWFYFENKPLRAFGLAVGVGSAILFYGVNFIALQPHSTASFAFNFFGYSIQPSARLMVWIESSRTFFDNFLFGKGIGQDSCRVIFQNSDGSFSLLTDAHNIFLSVASQTGILGLFAITTLIFSILKISFANGLKKRDPLLFSLGLGF
ncbi:MAG: O-antigen ligase family protein, partial [Pyrinomonadaceae bacterium]